uniref:Uncharacterized protein n=1 Tax=Lotharella oceanica TaxID=641309 RepID=A0A7S2TP91_9EUKA|mmetsp:Transcript_21702/g.40655  ORF Transcript_21702/g.40655 Transcript_21702/m.40655 type:complete len:178 (+) Transcript_21702:40-573(+)|eukprot:CAMPEP_0170198534 /NCGR_PEP_ID=MMETSP0040_2-20121228/68830_1 /TAXON_ID=641309 /ORGANISM="Lotharella oceanica, Strain CCMP622" /LENGTH=177 /DNA_ID=CAMNT_0010448539 /DNA_START=377 /DNA_END=910 /DNA_ORIENTATION=-
MPSCGDEEARGSGCLARVPDSPERTRRFKIELENAAKMFGEGLIQEDEEEVIDDCELCTNPWCGMTVAQALEKVRRRRIVELLLRHHETMHVFSGFIIDYAFQKAGDRIYGEFVFLRTWGIEVLDFRGNHHVQSFLKFDFGSQTVRSNPPNEGVFEVVQAEDTNNKVFVINGVGNTQ